MTDLEKIKLLEHENLSLRTTIQQLRVELAESQELKEHLREMIIKVTQEIKRLSVLREEFETNVQQAHAFKQSYKEALDAALKTTVRPYAHACKVIKKRKHKI